MWEWRLMECREVWAIFSWNHLWKFLDYLHDFRGQWGVIEYDIISRSNLNPEIIYNLSWFHCLWLLFTIVLFLFGLEKAIYRIEISTFKQFSMNSDVNWISSISWKGRGEGRKFSHPQILSITSIWIDLHQNNVRYVLEINFPNFYE